jgi:hypothetical protein
MIDRYFDLKTKVSDIPWRELSEEEIDLVLMRRIDSFHARPSPKREGYVIERMAEMNNLRTADLEAQSGNKQKRNKHIRFHNKIAEQDLRKLQMMILTLDFPKNNYFVSRQKSDAGKIRDIVIQDYFPWRILPHAIMLVVGRKILRRFIYDSCACIKGKGLHFGVKRMKQYLRRYDFDYFWQCDYKKYYQSIPHVLIMNEFRKMYKDEQFLMLLELTLSSYDSDIDSVLDDERRKRIAHRGL